MHELEVCTESLEMELKLEVGALIFILYTAFFIIIKNKHRTSLVTQWIKIHLPVQRTWVPSQPRKI